MGINGFRISRLSGFALQSQRLKDIHDGQQVLGKIVSFASMAVTSHTSRKPLLEECTMDSTPQAERQLRGESLQL